MHTPKLKQVSFSKKTMLTMTDIPVKGELPFITLHMGAKYSPCQKNWKAQISTFHVTAALLQIFTQNAKQPNVSTCRFGDMIVQTLF